MSNMILVRYFYFFYLSLDEFPISVCVDRQDAYDLISSKYRHWI